MRQRGKKLPARAAKIALTAATAALLVLLWAPAAGAGLDDNLGRNRKVTNVAQDDDGGTSLYVNQKYPNDADHTGRGYNYGIVNQYKDNTHFVPPCSQPGGCRLRLRSSDGVVFLSVHRMCEINCGGGAYDWQSVDLGYGPPGGRGYTPRRTVAKLPRPQLDACIAADGLRVTWAIPEGSWAAGENWVVQAQIVQADDHDAYGRSLGIRFVAWNDRKLTLAVSLGDGEAASVTAEARDSRRNPVDGPRARVVAAPASDPCADNPPAAEEEAEEDPPPDIAPPPVPSLPDLTIECVSGLYTLGARIVSYSDRVVSFAVTAPTAPEGWQYDTVYSGTYSGSWDGIPVERELAVHTLIGGRHEFRTTQVNAPKVTIVAHTRQRPADSDPGAPWSGWGPPATAEITLPTCPDDTDLVDTETDPLQPELYQGLLCAGGTISGSFRDWSHEAPEGTERRDEYEVEWRHDGIDRTWNPVRWSPRNTATHGHDAGTRFARFSFAAPDRGKAGELRLRGRGEQRNVGDEWAGWGDWTEWRPYQYRCPLARVSWLDTARTVTEGDTATFRLTSNLAAPADGIVVAVTVTYDPASGRDSAARGSLGLRVVTIAEHERTATITVATVDDDDPNDPGRYLLEIVAPDDPIAAGWREREPDTATLTVNDDDTPPQKPAAPTVPAPTLRMICTNDDGAQGVFRSWAKADGVPASSREVTYEVQWRHGSDAWATAAATEIGHNVTFSVAADPGNAVDFRVRGKGRQRTRANLLWSEWSDESAWSAWSTFSTPACPEPPPKPGAVKVVCAGVAGRPTSAVVTWGAAGADGQLERYRYEVSWRYGVSDGDASTPHTVTVGPEEALTVTLTPADPFAAANFRDPADLASVRVRAQVQRRASASDPWGTWGAWSADSGAPTMPRQAGAVACIATISAS